MTNHGKRRKQILLCLMFCLIFFLFVGMMGVNVRAEIDEDSTEDSTEEDRSEDEDLLEGWSSYVKWIDNGNAYETRPRASDVNDQFTVKRYTESQGISSAETLGVETSHEITAELESDSNTWKITLSKAAAKNSDGEEYIYFLVQKNAVSTDSDKGNYQTTYKNSGDFVYETNALFNGGTLSNQLKGKVTFSVTTTWQDGKAEDSENRPDMTMSLYRVIENEQGAISAADIAKAVEVKKATVAKTDGSLDFGSNLEAFDSRGHRYVYFALEKGSAEDYEIVIDNSTSSESEAIQTIFADIKANGHIKYILNGGSLTNQRGSTVKLEATATFKADSMKSDLANSYVIYQLQYKTDQEGSSWQNLTGDAEGKCALIASYDEETTTISQQGVFLKLSGFSKSKTAVSNNSLLCRKYDADSHVISYRFVEVKLSMDGKTEINVSPSTESDGSVTYDEVNAGNVAPGVGGSKTTAYFALDQSGNTVTHTLTGITRIEITNQWFDGDDNNISGDTGKDDQLDSVYTSYHIVRSDGASTKNSTLFDLDGSVVGLIYSCVIINGSSLNAAKTHWITTIDKLPRFDGSGKEYTYTVEPIVQNNTGNAANDPHGVRWTETTNTVCSTATVDQDNISKVSAQYVYSQNSPNKFSFTIDAQWKDDGDLSSRREIKYELRNIDTGNKVSEGTLSAANGWHDVLYFDRNNDEDTIDNYVILETEIGGVQADYSMFSTDGKIEYDSILGFENAQFGQNSNYNSAASIAKIEENDNSQLTDHYYNIFIDGSVTNQENAKVTITNQRQATDMLTLEQTWATGKDCPGVTYQLLRNGQSLAWANYSCGDSQKYADKDGKFTLTGNQSLTSSLYNQTASFTVDKYDIDGKEYNYEFKAVSLNKNNNTYNLSDGKAVIDGTNYGENLYYDEEASTMAGAQKHNNGSNYVWKGALTKRDLVNLKAHLVWRDNGETERPEVSFNVYRVSLADHKNLASLIAANNTDDLISALKAIGTSGSPVACDMDWDQVNGWYQSAHLASLPRFDLNGYEYVYYLMETTNVVDGDYQTFYSNLTSETNGYLPSTSKNVNDSKDVYAVEEQSFDGSGSLTILADGIHSKDGDFGAYYAGTVVNKIKKTRIISGKNTYQLPEGMSMDKNILPSVTIKLYQTLSKGNFDGIYTQKELKEFLQAKGIGEDQIVETMSLSAESAGAFQKAGSRGYTFTFGAGSVTLDEYDEFGRQYHYYIMEDDLENYPDDKIVTNEATFSMVNTYVFKENYVEIPIKKTWVKDSNIEKALNAPPAHFKLYARMQDKEGTPLDDTYLMAQTTLVPDENAKAEYTFTAYSEGTGDNENARLTYMAPNEQPWAYFVVEEGIDAYEEAVKIDGSWNTESATDLVRVTIPEPSSNTDVTAIEYQNTYTPGSTSFDVEAKWVDGDSADVDNSEFRPSSVTMQIYRKWDGNSTAPEGSAAASSGDELYASYDLTSQNSWKKSVTNAPKYAENGMEYSYYLKSQTGSDEGNTNKLSHYSSNISQTDFSVTNTLKVTSLSYSIDWQWYLDNGVSGRTMTKDVYQMLQDFEVLPSTITTYVQRKTDQDAEWEFVPAKSESSKKVSHPNGNTGQVLGIKLDLTKATTLKEFTKGISGISFSDLPQYKSDTSDNIQYKYRVVECLTWAGGNNRWWYDTEASNNDVLKPQESPFAAMTATKLDKTVNKIPTQTITNYINMVSTVLEKKWNDDGNIDNTRPETITFTVKKAGSNTASHDFVLSGSSQSDKNVYSSGTVYLPKAANDGGSEQMNATYSVTEERTEGSTGLVAVGGNGIYESDSTQEVKFAKQGNSKVFTYSITNVLKNHTRPTTNYNASVSFADASLGTDMINMIRPASVRVTLYYKASDGKYYPVKDASEADKTAAGGFVIAESTTDLATYTVKNLTLAASTAGAEGSHNFTNLTKYWVLDENSAGTRKEIEYAVKEEFLDSNGNVINASYTSDASISAADGSMLSTGAITNTPDLFQPIISKIWKYSDDQEMESEQIDIRVENGYLPETIRYTLTENSAAGDFSEAQTQDITVADLLRGDVKWSKQYPKYDKNGNQIVYTVTETGYKFKDSKVYVASVSVLSTNPVTIPTTDGYTAKLESIYQTTSVTANLSWDDQNNAFGLRPSKVLVSVKISGESDEITDGDISESDGWSNTFNYLPKYSASGEEIQYTLDADTVAGYQVASIENGVITYTFAGTELTLSDIWKYSNGETITEENLNSLIAKNSIPASLKLELTAQYKGTDGNNVDLKLDQSVEVASTVKNGVKWNVNLPEKDASGDDISYAISLKSATYQDGTEKIARITGITFSASTPTKTDGSYKASIENTYALTHTWTYTASGANLTASCKGECGTNAFHTASLTLSASDNPYSGQAVTASYGSGQAENWKSATGSDAPIISYQSKNGETWTDLEQAPSDVGNYRAVAKVTQDSTTSTAAVEFAITHVHVFAEEWSNDADSHWHPCSGNGATADCKEAEGSQKAAHSWNAGQVTKASTETEEGEKTYTCTVCQKTKTEPIAKLGHEKGTYHQAVAASCAATGTVEYWECKNCEGKLDGSGNLLSSIETAKNPSNHVGGTELIGKVDPTCAVTGYTGDVYCKGCNSKLADGSTILVSGNHGATETRNFKAPTCAEAGYTGDIYCTVCNQKLSSGSTIEATGQHAWNDGQVTKEASETAEGEKTYTCTVCQKTKTEPIDKLSHEKGTHHQAVAASCAATGTLEYWECKNCDENLDADGNLLSNIVVAKDPANHAGGREVKNAKAATCGQAGYTGDSYCKGCNNKLAGGSTIEATGKHSWDAGKVTKEATTAQEGIKTYTCSVCRESKTETIPKVAETSTENPKPATAAKASESTTAKIRINKGFTVTQTGNKLTVEWGKVEGATRYEVYANYCGRDGYKLVKKVKGLKVSVTKLSGKSLNTKKNYKVYVVAKKGNKILAKTILAHVAGSKNKTRTNAKSLKITSKKELTLTPGKTSTIKGKTILINSRKKEIAHTSKLRFASSNPNVATVTAKGLVTAKAAGSCWIYVYAQNGVSAKVKVTVK